MKTFFSLKTLIFLFVASLVGVTLFYISSSRDFSREDHSSPYVLVNYKGASHITAAISEEILNSYFKKSGNVGFYISFYPVMKGESKASKPEIVSFYTDFNGKPLSESPELPSEEFKKQYNNYLHFVKSIGVPKETIAQRYQLRVDAIFLGLCKEVNVTLALASQKMYYLNKCCTPIKAPQPTPLYSDSILCCKCPPACTESTLAQASIASELLQQVYK